MSEKIVLFSTTPGMSKRCREVLRLRGYKNIPIYEMTTAMALEQAEKCIREGTRVIICRGGTAEYLRRFLEIPIIDVRHSFLSIFLTVRKLRKQYQNIVIIGFYQICEAARKYNTVMQDDVRIYEVSSTEQFENQFHIAVKNGAQVIVGGFQIAEICQKYQFPYYSTEPDDYEISQALDEALYSLRIEEERSQQVSLLSTVLNSTNEGIVSINHEGVILHINRIARNLLQCSTGMQISDIMPAEKILQTASSGEEFYSEIVTIRGVSVVCNCQAIRLQGMVAGAVLTLQEENTIRILDSRIRKRELNHGYYAKKDFGDIIGSSPTLEAVKRMAKRYAKSDSTVLITGETGTGKELFAQAIHNYSRRHHEPFVAINCAALPQSILESELFGYVKGAFTGARSEGKAGIFELAHKGTVFLDEISEMSTDVQVKLLRVLQEKEVTRIGDDKVIPIDVRILAASNKDLQIEIKEGRFRSDLFYRICVLELHIPPLRERKQDISELVRHFMQGRKSLTVRAEQIMAEYSWPGNIRQLSNITECLDVLYDNNIITEEDVRQVLQSPQNRQIDNAYPQNNLCNFDSSRKIEDMADKIIRDVLQQVDGNRKQAAQILGISRTTLWRKLKKLGL